MTTVDSKFITKEAFDTLQKEVKALEKAQASQRELMINSTSISKGDLKGMKAEIIMWVVGLMIAFGALIFIVLDQRIDDINQRIGDVRENVNANKAAIAENKAMLQKVLDKLDDLDNQKQN